MKKLKAADLNSKNPNDSPQRKWMEYLQDKINQGSGDFVQSAEAFCDHNRDILNTVAIAQALLNKEIEYVVFDNMFSDVTLVALADNVEVLCVPNYVSYSVLSQALNEMKEAKSAKKGGTK